MPGSPEGACDDGRAASTVVAHGMRAKTMNVTIAATWSRVMQIRFMMTLDG
jgi:hypothetical protein